MKKIYEINEAKKRFYKKNPLLQTVISIGFIVLWVFAFKSSVLDANNIPSGSMQPTLKIGDFLFVNKMRYNFRIPFTNFSILPLDKPHRGDIVTFIPPQNSGLDGKTLVKRVVGLPGDTLEVRDNEIFINGSKYPVRAMTTAADRKVLDDMDCQKANCPSKENLFLFLETVRNPDGTPVREHYMLKNRDSSGRNNFVQSKNCTTNDLIMSMPASDPCPTWKNPIPKDMYMVMGDNRDNSSDSRVWGLVNLKDIQGKVFISYFSVNWQIRESDEREDVHNPIFLLWETITRQRKGVFVRWDRIGRRIF